MTSCVSSLGTLFIGITDAILCVNHLLHLNGILSVLDVRLMLITDYRLISALQSIMGPL